MIRTQIYLTEQQRADLAALSQSSGANQSELIRQAVDAYLQRQSSLGREDVLDRAAGVWKDRSDLPDFGKLRQGWDRQEWDCE